MLGLLTEMIQAWGWAWPSSFHVKKVSAEQRLAETSRDKSWTGMAFWWP